MDLSTSFNHLSFGNLFKKENQFELSDVGDLSTYSFTQLAQKLPNFIINIESFQHFFIAKFESKHTTIRIKYSSIGEFDSIINESWK